MTWGSWNTLIPLPISYFRKKNHEGPKWLELLFCILGFQISTAFQASHYLLARKFESWPFWARCLEEIAYRSTLLYIKDIFLKNSVQHMVLINKILCSMYLGRLFKEFYDGSFCKVEKSPFNIPFM